MTSMSPFEFPPSTPPVSFDPPGGRRSHRSRRRTVGVALASAGLTAGAIVVIGSIAGANGAGSNPQLVGASPVPVASVPASTEPADTQPSGEPSDAPGQPTGTVDGTIVIRIGDNDPITIDLGDLPSWFQTGEGTGGGPALGPLGECFDQLFDIDVWGRFGDPSHMPMPSPGGLDVFGDGAYVTVIGPDGMSVIDFGDGDGSVTVTQHDGQLTVTSDGDVSVDDLSEWADTVFDTPAGSLPAISVPDLRDLGAIEDCLARAGSDQG
jgi:hypothetical protein